MEQVDDMIETAISPTDRSLLAQCQEEVSDYKKNLATLYDELSVFDDDELFTAHTALERQLSTVSQKIKSLLVPLMSTYTRSITTDTGVKLPKLDVPTFDGNLIHWKLYTTRQACPTPRRQSTYNMPSRMDLLRMPLRDCPILETTTQKPLNASSHVTTDHVTSSALMYSS